MRDEGVLSIRIIVAYIRLLLITASDYFELSYCDTYEVKDQHLIEDATALERNGDSQRLRQWLWQP